MRLPVLWHKVIHGPSVGLLGGAKRPLNRQKFAHVMCKYLQSLNILQRPISDIDDGKGNFDKKTSQLNVCFVDHKAHLRTDSPSHQL
jgi:hypothetical protein